MIIDDWAEDKHDVELQNESGRVLARVTLREGVDVIARLHAMIGEQIGDDDEADVAVGIETGGGPWVQALIAAGYTVYAINPLHVARAPRQSTADLNRFRAKHHIRLAG